MATTRSEMIAEMVTKFQDMLAAQTDKGIMYVHKRREKLQTRIATLVTTLTVPTHKDIYIVAKSGDRTYACYGFLEEMEESIKAEVMFSRAHKRPGVPVCEDEYKYIIEHDFFEPNSELERYTLISDRNLPKEEKHFTIFNHHDYGWGDGWGALVGEFSSSSLVIRRLT